MRQAFPVDLNEGMDMNDYGDPMDYYDEELEDSGDSSISPAQA